MTLLNVPAEWLSLGFEWTWMLLLEDAQQGAFYSTLFCFWVIFCGEHLMVSTLYFLSTVLFSTLQWPLMQIFFSTTNPEGPKSEESSLGVLVAGWAGDVWLVSSPLIRPERQVVTCF